MRCEDMEFIVTDVTASTFDAYGVPVFVNVTAKFCGDDEMVFRCLAKSAPKVSETVTVTVEWGEGE